MTPRLKRVETWLTAAQMGLAALLLTEYAKTLPPGVLAGLVALAAVLSWLAGDRTAAKAHAEPPPAKLPAKRPPTNLGPPAVAVLLLAALGASGCAGWRDTTKRSLAIAQDVAITAHSAANKACKPVVAKCIKAKTNPCADLQHCHQKRRIVYQALVDTHTALALAYRSVDVAEEPQVMQVVALALDAARDVCRALAAWGHPVAACKLLGGAR